MMGAVADRIYKMMELLHFKSVHSAARDLSINTSTLQTVISRQRISRKTAARIAAKWGFAVDWVERGYGPMISDDRPLYASEIRGPSETGRHASERLRAMMDSRGLGSVDQLAGQTNIPAPELTAILDTDTISRNQAVRIAAALHCSAEWLFSGQGPSEPLGNEIQGFMGASSDYAVATVTRCIGGTGESRFPLIMVPKAKTRVSAGGGAIPEEGTTGEEYAFREEWLRKIAADPHKVILIDVDGDSMVPTLLDKDIILIDMNRKTIKDGRIFAIAIGDALIVKRLQIIPGELIKVISDNPAYDSFPVRPNELRIIGQVVWYARALV
jgi:hypothetical protein